MELPIWNTVASKMAATLRHIRPARPLGVLLVYHGSEKGLVVWLYDCDTDGPEEPLDFELEFLRRRLKEAGVAEMGFGLSADGRAWSLVGHTGPIPFDTQAGKAFHREMLAEDLSEALHEAWLSAHRDLARAPKPEAVHKV